VARRSESFDHSVGEQVACCELGLEQRHVDLLGQVHQLLLANLEFLAVLLEEREFVVK